MAIVTYQVRGYTGSKAGMERIDQVRALSQGLYNAALAERRDAYRQGVRISRFDQTKELTDIRDDDPQGVGGIAVEIGRGAIVRNDRAFDGFFRRVKAGETPGYPRFKSFKRYRTIELSEARPGMLKLNGNKYHLNIKGLPKISIPKVSRPLPDTDALKTIRITRHDRRLSIDLVFDVERETLPETGRAVGIDMGVTDRMALSDGTHILRRDTTAHRRDIERKQRRVSRSKRGSKTRRKRVSILANAHAREAVRNRNETHRLTTAIVNAYDVIVLEDLAPSRMTRSAKGTQDAPGSNVAAKSGLNRSINEQTWGILRNQLTYKAEWAGRQLIAVPPQYTSQTCAACGTIDRNARNGKVYHCPTCGYEEDADINAALNILHRGMEGVETVSARNHPPAGLTCQKSTPTQGRLPLGDAAYGFIP